MDDFILVNDPNNMHMIVSHRLLVATDSHRRGLEVREGIASCRGIDRAEEKLIR